MSDSGPGLVLLAVLVGLAAGCLLATQPSINGQLSKHVAHPLQATLISFGSGTVIIFLITILSSNFPIRFTSPPSQLPLWVWFGGAIGVVMVTTSLLLVPRVGSLTWFAAVMTGQTVTALLLDHYGLLGTPRAAVSPLRVLGTCLLIAGVLVIVQAKRQEHFEQATRTGTTASAADSD